MKKFRIGWWFLVSALVWFGTEAEEKKAEEAGSDVLVEAFPTPDLGNVTSRPSGEMVIDLNRDLWVNGGLYRVSLAFPSKEAYKAVVEHSISRLTLQDLDAAVVQVGKEPRMFPKEELAEMTLAELVSVANGKVAGDDVMRGTVELGPDAVVGISLREGVKNVP